MLHLLQSEWLKLSKRPLSWILLATFLVLMVLQYVQHYFIVSLGASFLVEAQVVDIRQRLMFPGAFGAAFEHINGLGGIFAVILAAGAIGGEYSWGTLRTYLPHQPQRATYLLAKIVVLLLALLAAMLATLVVGGLSALVFGKMLGETGTINGGDLLQLPLALVRALLVLLPYVLVTIAAVVVSRSLLIGLVSGLLFQFADIGFGAITTFARLGDMWQLVYQLTVQANINTLTFLNRTAFGLDPTAMNTSFDVALLPSSIQAVGVVVLYCAVSLFIALRSFQRNDIAGPQ